MISLQKKILASILIVTAVSVNGQSGITPRKLGVSEKMTTNLIFPQPIISVDLGSAGLLAQRAEGVQNILQVKAEGPTLERTNLTVITQDGTLHSFLVNYSEYAEPINLSLQAGQTDSYRSIPNGRRVPTEQVKEALEWARSTDLTPLRLRRNSNGISLSLDGIFIQGDRMYLRFRIYNDSHIPYQIDQFRFFLKGTRGTKRTAEQEVEILPEFVDGDLEGFHEHVQHTLVFVLPSFTLPTGKHLSIEIMELSGGRNLSQKVKNRHLLKALPIPTGIK